MQNVVTAISNIIDNLKKDKEQLIIAIDGRCASGKTTLALKLQEQYDLNVIHMDHFFLRMEQRTKERLNTAGENIDHERFLEEVLLPLREGKAFEYCPYDCGTGRLAKPIPVTPKGINIVEGSYSCHKELWKYYDVKLFLSVKKDEQLRRITLREGKEKVEVFKNKWIPMEEKYFSAYEIDRRCDYCFET